TQLASTSSAPTLPAPNETQYGGTGTIGPSTTWSVIATCDGKSGTPCTVKLSAAQSILPIQWKFSSAPTPVASCTGAVGVGTFTEVTNGATILSVVAGATCTLDLVFQAKALS